MGGSGAPNIEELTDLDIAKLEREVEDLLRNRVTSAADLISGGGGIVNIHSKQDFRITKSAQVGKR